MINTLVTKLWAEGFKGGKLPRGHGYERQVNMFLHMKSSKPDGETVAVYVTLDKLLPSSATIRTTDHEYRADINVEAIYKVGGRTRRSQIISTSGGSPEKNDFVILSHEIDQYMLDRIEQKLGDALYAARRRVG